MHEIHIAYVLLLGAAGGLLNHLYLHENTLLMPRLSESGGERGLSLGFLSDVVLGIGGALVGMYLIAGAGAPVLRQVAASLLGGFSGGALLARNTIELERQRQQLKGYFLEKAEPLQSGGPAVKRGAGLARRIERASSVFELGQIRREIDRAVGRTKPSQPAAQAGDNRAR